MAETTYRGRRVWQIENDTIRITLTVEGGHLAELLHKPTGVNPMWAPPWQSIEPSSFDPAKHGDTYGTHGESRLLAGIMGHNLCMDIFGGPSEAEAAAGMTPHGEGSIVPYRMSMQGGALVAEAEFPMAQLSFTRRVRLHGHVAVIEETVRNLAATDKPAAWTHHVTLGPPFIEKGQTQFRVTATKSRVYETDFGGEFGRYLTGADFDWPLVPLKQGGSLDLRTMPDASASSGYTAHLMDQRREHSFFVAWTPSAKVACGYVWRREDFPWLGLWEENHARAAAPWNSQTLTRGMEFGVSPMAESRRQMIERGSMFGVPGYRWIPAKGEVRVVYAAFITTADAVPEEVEWDEAGKVALS
ncbi:MAG: hypothetical protein HY820_10700 [Acidobacteria bacterium]|nr:hypothetical protein [Acidobacteriota bacterium]